MEVQIEDSWKVALQAEFEKPYFSTLRESVRRAYLYDTVFPSPKDLFSAFTHCPLPAVRVVILGQDPYHGPGQAHGLAFSVRDDVAIPPSLMNIYKEISRDFGVPRATSGNLTHWADQGVLLLNSSLTVKAGIAGSHQKFGWEIFTNEVIRTVSETQDHVVFLLWGACAQKKSNLIDESKHLILTAPHPSPLSAHRGFIGCGHFSKTNEYLNNHGLQEIEW
jgi:uracil-DNA glycosylase